MDAYLSALERRLADGRPLETVASVASFFLSRIDRLVDPLLKQRDLPGEGRSISDRLRAKAGVAAAKLAYRSFRRAFSGERWDRLAVKGARVQRPLWASTGTKDPTYRDVWYVEEVIGRHTVTTMPEQTMRAFADHGEVRPNQIEEGVEQAARPSKIFRKPASSRIASPGNSNMREFGSSSTRSMRPITRWKRNGAVPS